MQYKLHERCVRRWKELQVSRRGSLAQCRLPLALAKSVAASSSFERASGLSWSSVDSAGLLDWEEHSLLLVSSQMLE
jgi:hypothetical protein